MNTFGFYTPSVVLSSDLPDVIIFTSHEAVDFCMSSNGYVLLQGRYYAIDGKAIVTDITSIIEHFLAGNTDNNLCDIRLEAYVGGDETDYIETTFRVLYCDKATGLSDPLLWLRENFLTLTRSRRLAPSSFINLSWYTTEREGISFRVFCTFLDDKGQRGTYSYVHSGNGLIAHINGLMTECVMLSDVRQRVMTSLKLESVTLQSVTVRCGNRSASYFIDPALAAVVPFYYLNCFGVPEHISMPCTTTEKLKTDRSVALLGKTSQFYDITHSKEYEVESGPLTADECLQVEQMLTSPSVRIPIPPNVEIFETDFDAMQPILITDFTCEFSDTDEKLNKVKFTWRHSANRPLMEAPQTPGIFNDKFNPTYS